MPDLPDWYTQVQPATMEAVSLTHGADAAKPASPTAGVVYYATDTKILYICATDGIWTGFDASILVQGALTLYANLIAGGYRLTGLGAPTTQNDALRYGQTEIRNAEIAASAAIAYSKLALSLSIVNADIATGAAIAYSKLALSGSIVNGDISALAAIAYSKLNLLVSIVNADIATGAAIVYSKLNLSLSILNADIATGAAIVYSKLNLSLSILNADIATTAAIVYSKLALSNSILTADILSTEFNVANKLLKLDGSALVPAARIPDLFLKYTGGTMSGAIAMGTKQITGLAAGASAGDALRYEQLVGVYPKATNGEYIGTDTVNRAIPHGLGASPKIVLLFGAEGVYTYRIHALYALVIANCEGTYVRLAVTEFDGTNFYVGNATNYTHSANHNLMGYRWTAIG